MKFTLNTLSLFFGKLPPQQNYLIYTIFIKVLYFIKLAIKKLKGGFSNYI
jgi:hypothetical protein